MAEISKYFFKKPSATMDLEIFSVSQIAQIAERLAEFTNAMIVLVQKGYC